MWGFMFEPWIGKFILNRKKTGCKRALAFSTSQAGEEKTSICLNTSLGEFESL